MEGNEPAYLLKMVRRVKSTGRSEANGFQNDSEAFLGVGEDYSVSFEIKDVSGVTVEGLDLSNQDKLQNGEYIVPNYHRALLKC